MTVFTFGNTNITTFEQHKKAFATRYNAGQDINHNTTTPNLHDTTFQYKLGKVVDFHEDIIKQLYTTIQDHERKLLHYSTIFQMYTEKQMELEQRMEKLEKNNQVLHMHNSALREHVDYLMMEDKKREDKEKYEKLQERHDNLMKELKEIENDMKFYKKVNEDTF